MGAVPLEGRVADPRPVIGSESGHSVVVGVRCSACGHPVARAVPRCPRCRSDTVPATFGPTGTVWSFTTVHVAADGHDTPYTLAYLDLEDGPRLLVDLVGDVSATRVGAPARLCPETPLGNPAAELC